VRDIPDLVAAQSTLHYADNQPDHERSCAHAKDRGAKLAIEPLSEKQGSNAGVHNSRNSDVTMTLPSFDLA
jgi:hypothetical protein